VNKSKRLFFSNLWSANLVSGKKGDLKTSLNSGKNGFPNLFCSAEPQGKYPRNTDKDTAMLKTENFLMKFLKLLDKRTETRRGKKKTLVALKSKAIPDKIPAKTTGLKSVFKTTVEFDDFNIKFKPVS
jgi:hypothetical protein